MDENISRKAVLVLVLLSIIISIFSTTLVINTVYHINENSDVQNGQISQPNGKLSLTVDEGTPSSSGTAVIYVPASSS